MFTIRCWCVFSSSSSFFMLWLLQLKYIPGLYAKWFNNLFLFIPNVKDTVILTALQSDRKKKKNIQIRSIYWLILAMFCLIHLNDDHYTATNQSLGLKPLREEREKEAKKWNKHTHTHTNNLYLSIGPIMESSPKHQIKMNMALAYGEQPNEKKNNTNDNKHWNSRIYIKWYAVYRIKQICIYCILDKYGDYVAFIKERRFFRGFWFRI